MAKKLELNKKTLRVLSAEEIEAVAGGADATELRTICGPQSTMLAVQAPAPSDDTTATGTL